MADSNITKLALARSLRDLLNEKEYKKISIADICDRCSMNRKSFYYHFKDKYDLVNWIFDYEIGTRLVAEPNNCSDSFAELCYYFYKNKEYYRKMFNVEGQNSFSSHFSEVCRSIIDGCFSTADKEELLFQTDIACCVVTSVFKAWLNEKELKDPKAFTECFKSVLVSLSAFQK